MAESWTSNLTGYAARRFPMFWKGTCPVLISLKKDNLDKWCRVDIVSELQLDQYYHTPSQEQRPKGHQWLSPWTPNWRVILAWSGNVTRVLHFTEYNSGRQETKKQSGCRFYKLEKAFVSG